MGKVKEQNRNMNESFKVTDRIAKDKWSKFVYNHPQGNIFQTPELAEVYKRTKNYEPITLAAVDDATDEILAVLLAVVIKVKSGILGSFSKWSLIQGGPLFVDEGLEAAHTMIQYYDSIVKKKAIYTEVRMLHEMHEVKEIMMPREYVFEEHFNSLIDLNKSKEELWEQIKRDKKRGITKAKKLGITIEESYEKENIRVFYDLLQETYKRVHMPLPDISLYESIFDILVPQHKALFLFVKYDDKYIATQLALIYKDTVYALITGAIKEYLSYHPGDLLIWHLLEWGSENGYKTFDFGGGGTHTKNINIRNYKARFGSEFPNYGRYKKVYSPIKMKIAKKGFEIYRKVS